MLNAKGIEEYWEEQTKKGDNPCHYHNKWQDLYAFKTRTGAFRASDFRDAKKIVDLGCGVGEYTVALAKLTPAHIDAFDFPFNIERAKEAYPNHKTITFHPVAVPHESIGVALQDADVVYTTTVYVHFSPEARASFYEYIRGMKQGSRVILLEYIPDSVPSFQKGLPYKEVETVPEITQKFIAAGFACSEVRHVNFIDSFLFFHLGKNRWVYLLTRAGERILHVIGYTKSKYKLLTFTKA